MSTLKQRYSSSLVAIHFGTHTSIHECCKECHTTSVLINTSEDVGTTEHIICAGEHIRALEHTPFIATKKMCVNEHTFFNSAQERQE